MIAFLDALGVKQAVVAGYDWGARTADIMAALWPERCTGLVSVSGYLIGSQEINRKPLPPKAELSWWYQFYFATERGRAGYAANTRDFVRLIWQTASPTWKFSDETFNRSAPHSTIPTMWPSPSITTAGGLHWQTGKPSTIITSASLRNFPSSPCRR